MENFLNKALCGLQDLGVSGIIPIMSLVLLFFFRRLDFVGIRSQGSIPSKKERKIQTPEVSLLQEYNHEKMYSHEKLNLIHAIFRPTNLGKMMENVVSNYSI